MSLSSSNGGRPKFHPQRAHASSIAPEVAARLHRSLLEWYRRVKRDLPWRRTRDPYAIWLSEVMLQQTRVETVIPYYERFLAAYPTVEALAEAPIDDVLARWSGLGYYRRARSLHAGAAHVRDACGGAFPSSPDELLRVPGVGRYTAGAVASIAFEARAPLVDGNVARVLARVFGIEDDVRGAPGQAKLWRLAGDLVPEGAPGDWNQALMELGATTCAPRAPRCLVCPLHDDCRARREGTTAELPRLAPRAAPRAWARVALIAEGAITGAKASAPRGAKAGAMGRAKAGATGRAKAGAPADATGRAKSGAKTRIESGATSRGTEASGPAVLLARRAGDGLFGGMWEPPMVDVATDATAALPELERLVGARLPTTDLVGTVTHVLSHRRMTIACLRATAPPAPRLGASDEYDALELVALADLGARGVSTLTRKILAAAGLGDRSE